MDPAWTFLGNLMEWLQAVLTAITKRGLNFSITRRFSWTGYVKEEGKLPSESNNLIKLIDAICVAWDNTKYWPVVENGVIKTTYCNFFLNEVAKAMGCYDFEDPVTNHPFVADDMIRVMIASDQWQELRVAGLDPSQMQVALKSVQMWANQGYLTVAAASSAALGTPHAHVCVVRPGVMKSSGKWGMVPVVANVGREQFIGRAKSGPMKGEPVGVNEAFIQLPKFFSWKGLP